MIHKQENYQGLGNKIVSHYWWTRRERDEIRKLLGRGKECTCWATWWKESIWHSKEDRNQWQKSIRAGSHAPTSQQSTWVIVVVERDNWPTAINVIHVIFLHESWRLKNVSHRSIKYTNARHFGSVCNANATDMVIGNGRNFPSTSSTMVIFSLGWVGHWIVISRVQVKTTGRIVVGLQVRICPLQPWNDKQNWWCLSIHLMTLSHWQLLELTNKETQEHKFHIIHKQIIHSLLPSNPWHWIYTVGHKKGANLFSSVTGTLSKINGF